MRGRILPVFRLLTKYSDVSPLFSLVSRRGISKSSFLQTASVPRWRTAVTTLRGDNHTVDVDEAKNFVFLLEPHERQLILKELLAFEDSGEPADPPNAVELRKLAVHVALPFVGFGFLDNFLMIVFGSYIDIGIGMVFTISTMAAAALGNTISDVIGVWSASSIEHYSAKIGISPPKLSPKQMDMRRTRVIMSLGRAFGICLGCILGMSPLLFWDYSKEDPSSGKEETKAPSS